MIDTIYSNVTGEGKFALSVIRVSGEKAGEAIINLTIKKLPEKRKLVLRSIYSSTNNKNAVPIDKALVSWMPSPNSFTGENVVEFYLHGGSAVTNGVLKALGSIPTFRQAEPGEFTKRALINGKLNLIQAEAILDLINSETEAQRDFANRQIFGSLSIPVIKWRKKVVEIMALTEALLDFSDESDVPDFIDSSKQTKALIKEIENTLNKGRYFERISSGIKIVIAGKPNSGKSSLLNCLAKRDVAIVSNLPGTTRDILEVKLDIEGYPVTLMDTAGLTKTKNIVEKEGIKRAKKKISDADIIFHLKDIQDKKNHKKLKNNEWILFNKTDLVKNKNIPPNKNKIFYISCKKEKGMIELLATLGKEVKRLSGMAEKANIIISKERQEKALKDALKSLKLSIKTQEQEISAEHLRATCYSLDNILGTIDVEDVLNKIFSKFCIGK